MIKKFKHYKTNESYNLEYRDIIKRKLLQLFKDKYWFLYEKRNGLGLRRIIDEFLIPISTYIDGNLIGKYQYPLSLLYETINRKLIEKRGDRFFCRELKGNFVLENGEWSYLNKLNTNIYALIDLLSDYFQDLYNMYSIDSFDINITENDPYGEENDIEKTPDFYWMGFTDIVENDYDIESFKSDIYTYIHWDDRDFGMNINTWLNKKFENRYNLNKYINVIKENSFKGEKAEEIVSNFFENRKTKVLYKGGNGDLIDMVFGCDLILEKRDKILTVQVKSYSLKYIDFSKNKQYQNIDVIVGVDQNDGITMLYNNKIYNY